MRNGRRRRGLGEISRRSADGCSPVRKASAAAMVSSLIAQLGYRPRTTVWATSLERRSEMSGMAAEVLATYSPSSPSDPNGRSPDEVRV